MKVTVIIVCLIGAVFANPILHNVSVASSQLDSNSTESLSVSQSSENDTSELQSSEENTSNQSSESQSESESLESTSEDKTSEESDSQSDEDDANDSMPETQDDSMGSEENVRKSFARVFASVVKVLSAEDNSSSTEVMGQPESLSNELVDKQSKARTNLETPTGSSDTSSNSADTSDSIEATPATSDSSDSTSEESDENTSDSSDASKSSEDSDASDSSELAQVKDCVNGTQSCESEEYFFQNIGDDGHFSVDNLMVPEEDERQLSLRR